MTLNNAVCRRCNKPMFVAILSSEESNKEPITRICDSCALRRMKSLQTKDILPQRLGAGTALLDDQTPRPPSQTIGPAGIARAEELLSLGSRPSTVAKELNIDESVIRKALNLPPK